MAEEQDREITRLLNLAASGDAHAIGAVFPLIYAELASAKRAQLPHGETLATTALVHEAYLRIAERNPEGWAGARHFYFTAVRAMRDILVEETRRKASLKRGGRLVSLEESAWRRLCSMKVAARKWSPPRVRPHPRAKEVAEELRKLEAR